MTVKTYPVEDLDVDQLVGMEENPNEMTDDQFSVLVEEIAEYGWRDPIQVVGPKADGTYTIVSGHHRTKAARVLGMEAVPATVVPADEWSRDVEEIQLVKQNVLSGELNPEKFTELFNKLAKRYEKDVLRRMMAFTEQDAFQRLYLDAKKALPPEMQTKLDEVKDEIKTVDDLSLVLNSLFTKYGNTLDANFMVFTYGGRKSILVRLQTMGAWNRVKKLAEWCHENGLKMDEQIMMRMDWPGGDEVVDGAGRSDVLIDELGGKATFVE